jgi:hypothetical protein
VRFCVVWKRTPVPVVDNDADPFPNPTCVCENVSRCVLGGEEVSRGVRVFAITLEIEDSYIITRLLYWMESETRKVFVRTHSRVHFHDGHSRKCARILRERKCTTRLEAPAGRHDEWE